MLNGIFTGSDEVVVVEAAVGDKAAVEDEDVAKNTGVGVVEDDVVATDEDVDEEPVEVVVKKSVDRNRTTTACAPNPSPGFRVASAMTIVA